jgi:7-carboxy-7-deazaguanine synthase
MEKITYTEIFYSLQGEGRWAGVPSVFFRTYGCNFRCRKFGRPHNEQLEGHNPEVVEIIKHIDQYKKFENIPQEKTG